MLPREVSLHSVVPATSATCVDVNQHVQQPPHVPTSAVAITQGAVGLPLRAGPRGLHVRGVQAKPTVSDSLEQSPVRAHRACRCFHGQHLVGGRREFAQLHYHSRTVAYTMRPGRNDDEKQPALGEPGTDAVCTVRAHGGTLFSDVLFFLETTDCATKLHTRGRGSRRDGPSSPTSWRKPGGTRAPECDSTALKHRPSYRWWLLRSGLGEPINAFALRPSF